ncbi:MAG: hemin ABC transporter substrate-binding protein [Chloroflexota bacterium]
MTIEYQKKSDAGGNLHRVLDLSGKMVSQPNRSKFDYKDSPREKQTSNMLMLFLVMLLATLLAACVPVPAAETASQSATDATTTENSDAAMTATETDGSSLPRAMQDIDGNEVVIEDDSRIVALGGPVTEIVFALGAGERVVAVDTSSGYPESVKELPQVGYQRRISAEPILAMNPTLILATEEAGPPEAIQQLKDSGVTVLVLPREDTIEGAKEKIRRFAQALGLEAKGEDLIAQMEADLAEAAAVLAQVDQAPTVMFIYARGADSVSAAGTDTGAAAMIELAGAVNAISEYEGYKPLTAESAVTAAPDVLLLFTSGLQSVGGAEGLLGIPGLAQTPAGAEQAVIDMDGLYLTGFGPRTGKAVKELVYQLHPELKP